MPGKFANVQDTMCLRHGSASAKRSLVSPDCGMEDVDSRMDDPARRVRFQPRMRDGNVEGPAESAPTLQKGAASVFTVGKEPSDECGMFRDGVFLTAPHRNSSCHDDELYQCTVPRCGSE